jgi:hypothetical protein
LRLYLDPANHNEAAQITANFLKRPAASFEGWLFTNRDFYRDRNGVPNLKALQANIDKVKDSASSRLRSRWHHSPDVTLIEEAANRLR